MKISAASSDPDVATASSLTAQFIGDYNGAAVSPEGSFQFSWTDTRNGSACDAVDEWRTSGFTATKPNIYDSCEPSFGDSDIYVAHVTPQLGVEPESGLSLEADSLQKAYLAAYLQDG